MRRIVTPTVVGTHSTHLTRHGAANEARRLNVGPGHARPVEYRVRREGFLRYAVIAHQAKLIP